jgi:seryl-tRNA synthetase
MIDIKQLREQPEEYKRSAKLRGVKADVDKALELDGQRIELIQKVDKLRSELNVKGKPTAEELKDLQIIKIELEKLDKKLAKLDKEYQDELLGIPNLLAPGTPEGGEESNREEGKWGQAEKREVKDHLSLAQENDWLDFERGAKVAGSKFYFVKGALARLNLAIVQYALDFAAKEDFVPMLVPNLVNSRVAAGTGFLPRGEERQIYKTEDEDLNLIATAELPLTGYHADEILDPASLPQLFAGYSPCYRLEAGSYGKHSKGLFRVHQFDKVEMYVYSRPEESHKWHQKLLEIEEKFLQELEIPYRIVRIAAGDLGAAAYSKFDLEYWSPVDGEYREITSCSNCTDFQARRLSIRTRDTAGKTIPVHTLNGTLATTSRTTVAILENHQTADGKVKIPQALQKYYGGQWL